MQFDEKELQALASGLATRVADILESRLGERPEWAMSVPEAAAWAQVEEHVIRDAIASGRLQCVRVGRQVRIRRTDLFSMKS